MTDSDGRFGITALPGAGFLAVETPDAGYVRVPVQKSNRFETLYPQGFLAIDVAKDAEPKPIEITVKKGVALEAKAIGPDGKVVTNLVGFCEGIDAKLIDIWNQGQEFTDGVFKLPNADPARTYRVYLLQPEHELAAVVDLKPDSRLRSRSKSGFSRPRRFMASWSLRAVHLSRDTRMPCSCFVKPRAKRSATRSSPTRRHTRTSSGKRRCSRTVKS